jgi:hypothetical protein
MAKMPVGTGKMLICCAVHIGLMVFFIFSNADALFLFMVKCKVSVS